MDRPFYKEILWTPEMYEPGRSNGRVFEHREIASQMLKRKLGPQECVHHKDENRLNNDPQNLIVFSTVADHSRFHKGGAVVDNGDGTFRTQGRDWICACGSPVSTGNQQCLSCYRDKMARGIPPKSELADLIWEMPTTHVASLYGVSDVAVAKWCSKYGLQKPPRGYWKKLRAKQKQASASGS